MPYWNCYYHIIWATKYRQSCISPTHENVLYNAIIEKSSKLKCRVLAINGTTDHIHIAANITPSVAVSEYVGLVKGLSAYRMNNDFELAEKFYWQEGYGALTFGERSLGGILAYITNQKTHHAQNTLNAYLERIDE